MMATCFRVRVRFTGVSEEQPAAVVIPGGRSLQFPSRAQPVSLTRLCSFLSARARSSRNPDDSR
jgi:hypothetical protein